jgi:hypothetical protein
MVMLLVKDILLKRAIITDSIKETGYSVKDLISSPFKSNGRKHQPQKWPGINS